MKILVVYCHPSRSSFTYEVCQSFLKGLEAAGHEYILSDLYTMDFRTDMTEEEYLRETNYRSDLPVPEDVASEQSRIGNSDAIVFIYPVFWTEAPAKLVGWFDRVWTTGYAYAPDPRMKKLEKALFIACAGKSLQSLKETGELRAMETVMLGDRIRDRAKERKMVILDNITHWNEALRAELVPGHLQRAFELGKEF